MKNIKKRKKKKSSKLKIDNFWSSLRKKSLKTTVIPSKKNVEKTDNEKIEKIQEKKEIEIPKNDIMSYDEIDIDVEKMIN